MSKHTPGKWEINDLEDGSAEIVTWDYDADGEIEGSTVIVPSIWYDDEESKKRAELLRSSQDLLEALIRARDDLNNAAFLIRKQLGEHHWLPGIEKGKKIADAAIARAKGESS